MKEQFGLFLETNTLHIRGGSRGTGCKGCAPFLITPRDDLRFFNTTGILQRKKNYVVYWC